MSDSRNDSIGGGNKLFGKRWLMVAAVFILFVAIISAGGEEAPHEQLPQDGQAVETVAAQDKEEDRETATITFVVDGDTVELASGERVRLIGIDAPEQGEPFYSASRGALEGLVLQKQVRLGRDVSEKDEYGRLLRYIWVDGIFINREMVRTGYATAFPYEPDTRYAREIQQDEQEARATQRGMWAPSPEPEPAPAPAQSSSGYTLPPCASDDCDCGHFSTHNYAQWFHDTHDPYDRHRLDRDNDGIACESLP